MVEPSTAKQSAQLSATSDGFEGNIKPSLTGLQKSDPQFQDMVRRALAAEPAACNDYTVLSQWLDTQFTDWNEGAFSAVRGTAMTTLPQYDALLFENSSQNQYFGVNGEYTQQLTKAFKDLQRFWNIQSQDIVLVAMHGSIMQDRDKLIRTYQAVYGFTPTRAAFFADRVLAALKTYPELRNGNHPIFTFNAFALEGFTEEPFGTIPDKIVMGDGIMQAYTGIGYGDIAPQAILAHEFGHQIQFQLNLFGEQETPEATRRTELMADAYSAYYLSHARGAAMQWKRVQKFLQVFFNIGDCATTDLGHHGTPTQRMAAAQWGYELANNAQKQGHILTAQEFVVLFEAQLDRLASL